MPRLLRLGDQAQAAHQASDRGDRSPHHQRDRGALAAGEAKAKCGKAAPQVCPVRRAVATMPLALPLRSGGALDIKSFMFGTGKKPKPQPQPAIRQTMSATCGLVGSIANSAIPLPNNAIPRLPRIPAG